MLLNLDLSGADWVTAAMLCRDPSMLDVVSSGRSPHQVTGARICGVAEDLVVRENKIVGDENDPLVISSLRREHFPELATATFQPRTMSIRQMAKRANHGLNFREGYLVFSLTSEIPAPEAKNICNRYTCQCPSTGPGHDCRSAYPLIRAWWDATDHAIRKTRRLTNCFGRTVYFMGQIGNDTFKQAYSFLPQSTTFDCCRVAMTAMMEDASSDFRPAELLAQVHDSLLTQYLSRDFRAMARFALRLGRDYMRPELDYGDYLPWISKVDRTTDVRAVPRGQPYRLNTDLKAGFDWAGLVEIPSFMTITEEALAEKLREVYETKHPKRVQQAA